MEATSPVPRAVLGRSGISVGRLALGAWGFSNPDAAVAAQAKDDDTIVELLRIAFDAGMNLLDSAEVYSNEEHLGQLLKRLDNVPEDLVVSTKFGHGKGFEGDQIRRTVERSLDAFGMEKIPLFMLHDPRTSEDMSFIRSTRGALPALRDLQRQGVVGSIGIATGTLGPLLEAVECDEYDVVQFPRLYTLLNNAAKTSGLLEKAKEKNIGTILTSPFGGNILATGVRGVDTPQYGFSAALPEVVDAVGRMEAQADLQGIVLSDAAVAYPLHEEHIDVVVIGVASPTELVKDIGAATKVFDPEVLAAVARSGAIDPYFLGGPDFKLPFPADRVPVTP
ncbi:aldo/keto reductase [Pseudarthrobacter sp. YAF2]|uniref:aldo/keto reductase n=1 Tax=Pseudarthrobacter sp. YAF2 TaxID=3233078 RepID=UPI003F9CF8FE